MTAHVEELGYLTLLAKCLKELIRLYYFYFYVLMSWGPTGGQQTEYNT